MASRNPLRNAGGAIVRTWRVMIENSYGELLAPLVKTYLGKPRRSCSIIRV